MRKLLACLGFAGLIPALPIHGYGTLPDNPIAFGNCTAKVKVTSARLRAGPSLDAKILGLRAQDNPLYVTKVCGKWVQVVLATGDTAYMAAYLLSFPASEMLEQWKRANPPQSVGKKAKVKWAQVNFRKYPSSRSSRLGRFRYGEEVAVVSDLGNGWSLVQSRAAKGDENCFGFISNRALAKPDVPDPPEWITPLARLHVSPAEKLDPARESPAQYLARIAWSPRLFAIELKAKARLHPMDRESLTGNALVAVR